MGISPWQSVCLVLLGAILAVWIDDGSTTTEQILECAPTRPSLMVDPSVATENLQQSTDLLEKNTDKIVDSFDTQITEEAALRWNQNVLQSKGQSLNYLRDPKAFVDRFEECAVDPQCHIMLHHVSKTGGTTLEQALFPVFGQEVMHTCCHQRLRQQFYENPEEYCKLKFSSWQMFDDEFLEVVHACQETNPQRRTLILTTFREPTRTLLSYIHQMCNKVLHKRSERLQEACRACLYENSTDVWHTMAYIIERQIEGAYRVSQSLSDRKGEDENYIYHNETSTTVVVHTPHEHLIQNFTIDKARLQVLTLETNDIDSFLWHWQPDVIFGVANPEQAGQCSFRLTTELIKKLRPALSIYRKLLAGL